ncbi:AAA family ATPase [Microbacterium yannicii]|nr:AAA family ATPase [Microbacterium yannicii]MCO5954405.1 LuxR C-terminal-related transcriptional regulator [Microbacterium yannicii]
MSDSSTETESAERAPGARLLSTKTMVRMPQPDAVSRRALIERARAPHARIVAVTAPAGYGKSTMLAEWAAIEDRAVAWATVDTLDDDPVALMELLAAACHDISPHAGAVAQQLGGSGAGVLGRSAPLLAAVLRQAPAPFVLFVDDVHTAASPACRDVLEVMLAGMPAGSQIVLASRHEHDFLARFRAAGTVFEIVPDDLRVDADAARTMFAGVDAVISDDELTAAVERCEGWPAGLRLCALAVHAGADISELTRDGAFAADYLYNEALTGLSTEVREFLRRTAVLDQLSGPLCDAVLERDGSLAVLHDLEARNIFVVALDRRRRWFRYHDLFRAFLLSELHRVEPAAVAPLHRRAAEWLERNGSPELAVEHRLAAGDLPQAGELVVGLAMPVYQSGRVVVVDRWLSELEAGGEAMSSRVLAIAAWIAMLRGSSAAAEKWTAALGGEASSGQSPEDASAARSARAMIGVAMCARDSAQLLEDAQSAVALESGHSRWRGPALYLLGTAHVLAGDAAASRQVFLEASAHAHAANNTVAAILSDAELAVLALENGSLESAAAHADDAMAIVDGSQLDGYPTITLALAVSARVALRRGDTAAMSRLLARAMRARIDCTHAMPFVAIRSRLQLAMAFAATGDRASVAQLLSEIDDILGRRPHLERLAEQTAEFRRIVGDEWAMGVRPLSPAEMRLIPYLQTHLTVAEIGSRLFISRNTASTEIGSIYRKLGVGSRSAAVGRAIELGLLGE